METKQELLTLNGKEYILDIEQAKKLNLLKEKDNRVRSWEEFKKKYPNQFFQCLTEHESQALTAFTKLLKLRRDWIGKWEPDFTISDEKWTLYCRTNEVICDWCKIVSHVLTFPTERMAKEFLKTFRDLIEEAKILI